MGVLLLLALAIRLPVIFNFFDIGGEIAQTELVARHIVEYHEVPLIGVSASGGFFTHYSAVYDYMLAIFYAITGSFRGDLYFFVAAQLCTYLMAYLVTRAMFGRITATATLSVLVVWTYFNIPLNAVFAADFMLMSLGALFFSYHYRRVPWLIAASILFWVAVACSYAVFMAAPIFLVGLVLALRRISSRWPHVLGLASIWPLAASIVWAPLLAGATGRNIPFSSLVRTHFEGVSFAHFLHASEAIGKTFYRLVMPEMLLQWKMFMPGFIALCIGMYIFTQKDRTRRSYALLILALVVGSVTILSLSGQYVYDYHLLLLIIPLLILCVEVFSFFIRAVLKGRPVTTALCASLASLFLFFPAMSVLAMFDNYRLFIHPQLVNEDEREFERVAAEIAATVSTLQTRMGFSDAKFFQIRLYKEQLPHLVTGLGTDPWIPFMDATFYNILEKKLQTKLVDTTAFSEESPYIYGNFGYAPITDDTYLFLICQYTTRSADMIDCARVFEFREPSFSYPNTTHELLQGHGDVTVYLYTKHGER